MEKKKRQWDNKIAENYVAHWQVQSVADKLVLPGIFEPQPFLVLVLCFYMFFIDIFSKDSLWICI